MTNRKKLFEELRANHSESRLPANTLPKTLHYVTLHSGHFKRTSRQVPRAMRLTSSIIADAIFWFATTTRYMYILFKFYRCSQRAKEIHWKSQCLWWYEHQQKKSMYMYAGMAAFNTDNVEKKKEKKNGITVLITTFAVSIILSYQHFIIAHGGNQISHP